MSDFGSESFLSQFVEAVRKEDLAQMHTIYKQYPRVIEGRLDARSRTPLHIAALTGKPQALRFLLEHGANANALDGDHNPPLFLALAETHDDCIDLLLQHSTLELDYPRITDRITALHIAADSGELRFIQRLLDAGARTDLTALWEMGVTPATAEIWCAHKDFPEGRALFQAHAKLLPANDEPPTLRHLQLKDGWHHLDEIHQNHPLDKAALLQEPALAIRAIECYEAPALISFLAKQGEPLTPKDLYTPTGEPTPLLEAFAQRHALQHLFCENNWVGQPRDKLREAWRKLPDEHRWQVNNYTELLLNVSQHDPQIQNMPGRA